MTPADTLLKEQAVAIAALLLSLVSLYFTWKQHRLAHAQDQRRKPVLVAQYVEGHFVTDQASRCRSYMFKLSVSNPSDMDNSLARIELAIHYRLENGSRMVAKVAAFEPVAGDLVVPQRIGAHDTVAGCCRFETDVGLAASHQIDAYVLEVTDSYGDVAVVAPILLSERGNARQV